MKYDIPYLPCLHFVDMYNLDMAKTGWDGEGRSEDAFPTVMDRINPRAYNSAQPWKQWK